MLLRLGGIKKKIKQTSIISIYLQIVVFIRITQHFAFSIKMFGKSSKKNFLPQEGLNDESDKNSRMNKDNW